MNLRLWQFATLEMLDLALAKVSFEVEAEVFISYI